jgi:hypothetical protein
MKRCEDALRARSLGIAESIVVYVRRQSGISNPHLIPARFLENFRQEKLDENSTAI